jgi:ParB-like chromosome segregation protein Spo0J
LKVESFPIDDIQIPDRFRAFDPSRAAALAESVKLLGVRTPISIRIEPEMILDGEAVIDVPILVAGRHRLEAAKIVGMKDIDVIILHGSTEDECRLWEIAESLHRAELSVQERADHVAEWIRLTDSKLQLGQDVPIESKRSDGRGHRHEGGIAAASLELGINEKEAQRSIKIASISEEAKQAADEAGLDTQKARLAIASQPLEKQLEKVADLKRERDAAESRRRNQQTDRTIALTESEAYAQLRKLMNAWNEACPEARGLFLDEVQRPGEHAGNTRAPASSQRA